MTTQTVSAPGSDWHARLRAEPKNRALYHEYLQSPEWAARRDAALNAAGGSCQLCSSRKGLQAHHRTYDRIGAEELGDLTVLCRRCHKRFHGPVKVQKKKRGDELAPTVEMVAIAVQSLDDGKRFTTAEMAALFNCNSSRIGMRLTKLADRGDVIKVSKKQWKKPARREFLAQVQELADSWGAAVRVKPSKLQKLAHQNDKLHASQQRNKTKRRAA